MPLEPNSSPSPGGTYRSQGQVGQALATRNITELQRKLTNCAFPYSLRFPEFGKSLNLWGLSLVFFRCSSSWNLEIVNENETPGGFPRQAGICWFTRSRPGRQGGLAFCYGKQSAGAGGWVAGTAEEKRNFLSDLETKTTRFLLNSSQLFLFMMSGDHHQNPRRPGEQPLII